VHVGGGQRRAGAPLELLGVETPGGGVDAQRLDDALAVGVGGADRPLRRGAGRDRLGRPGGRGALVVVPVVVPVACVAHQDGPP